MVDYALAGAGWISAIHGLAVAAQPGGQVVAVASRTTASAEARVAETGGAVVAYDELPGEADIVVVATPPARHVVDALRAMAYGKAAVVEKPLCTTLDDADRLVRVVEAGGMLTYAENLLFAEPVSRALSEIATLGPLTHLATRTMQPRPTWGDFTERHWGGGALFDLGVHPLALVLRAAGRARPVGVKATLESSPDIDVDDRASVQLRFDTGLSASIEVSWREPQPIWDLQAASSNGVVVLELLPDVALERSGEPVALAPLPEDAGHPSQLDQFGYVEQLREAEVAWRDRRSPTTSDVYLGRDVLEVVCAAYLSARSRSETPLPYRGPRNLTPIELWRPTR